jgi:hypothetical protein
MIIAQRFIAGNGCTTNPESRRDNRNTCHSAIDFLRKLKGVRGIFQRFYKCYLNSNEK